ncbi:MAG: alpha/beta hydrolase [Rhodocyclaceae bacterium]|nr:alpha/beta hydrolase [Rhodocyclaceae bacterium]
MATFVLVHGGFQGGWSYRRVAALLEAAGHTVYRPTLTGLGERSHLRQMPINLDTHIDDIANTILWEDLSHVVLLGHSYGGMVVTGVAERIPERIATLVYLDALVPQDGDTLFTLRPEYRDVFLGKAAAGAGLAVAPSPASAFDTAAPADWAWMDGKTVPHPFACFTQSIRLSGKGAQVAKRVYIYAEGGICDGMYDPFRADAGATVVSIKQSGHSIMIDQPHRLAEILIDAVRSSSSTNGTR